MKELLGDNKRKETSRKLFIFNILREIKEDIATTKKGRGKNRMQVKEGLQRRGESNSNNQTPLGIKYLMEEIKKKLSRRAGKIKLRPKCQKDGIWEGKHKKIRGSV